MLGAGDAFMAGFLRGWLREEPLEQACAYANACGSIAVSRLLCSPEYPTWDELRHFLRIGSATRALRRDPGAQPSPLGDDAPPGAGDAEGARHRPPGAAGGDRRPGRRDAGGDRRLQAIGGAGGAGGGDGREGFGLLLDGTYGREALFDAAEHPFWIGRPVEKPGSRPLAFEASDLGSHLAEWPVVQTVKALCFYHPDDPPELKERQEAALLAVCTRPAAPPAASS